MTPTSDRQSRAAPAGVIVEPGVTVLAGGVPETGVVVLAGTATVTGLTVHEAGAEESDAQ